MEEGIMYGSKPMTLAGKRSPSGSTSNKTPNKLRKVITKTLFFIFNIERINLSSLSLVQNHLFLISNSYTAFG